MVGTSSIAHATADSEGVRAALRRRIIAQDQLEDFGRIDDPSSASHYGMGSLAVNKNNDVVAGHTPFSADSFPSAAYSFRAGTDPAGTFRAGVVYRNGDGQAP